MANLKDFLLPDLGEGLTEGEIVSWLVTVGDPVEVDQPVAEVETAKAVVEVPSPFSGTVTQLHGEPGDEVQVGLPLVTIDVDGGQSAEPPREAAADDAADEPEGIPGRTAKDAAAAEMVPSSTDKVESASALGDDNEGDSGSVLVGYGTAGPARSRRRRAAPVNGATGGRPPGDGRPLAKPPVRKLAKDLGVDLAAVRGSGPGGIVTRDDVHASAGDGREGAAAEDTAARGVAEPATAAVSAGDRPAASELVERIPIRGVRKAVAQKMAVSRREIPDATTWVDCDATRLWKLRERLNASQSRVKVSPLAILLRACVAGLREFPELNARLDVETNEIVLQHFVNLGFAAQTDTGLVVPNIKRADRLSVLGIAEELNRLAQAARERTVSPDDLTGGTFTVSNYGSFGVDGGSAVINHPEAAILGVGRIAERPWVHKGKLAVRRVLQLSIAFDHRICDGGEAAGFLRFVADCAEDPDTLLANL